MQLYAFYFLSNTHTNTYLFHSYQVRFRSWLLARRSELKNIHVRTTSNGEIITNDSVAFEAKFEMICKNVSNRANLLLAFQSSSNVRTLVSPRTLGKRWRKLRLILRCVIVWRRNVNPKKISNRCTEILKFVRSADEHLILSDAVARVRKGVTCRAGWSAYERVLSSCRTDSEYADVLESFSCLSFTPTTMTYHEATQTRVEDTLRHRIESHDTNERLLLALIQFACTFQSCKTLDTLRYVLTSKFAFTSSVREASWIAMRVIMLKNRKCSMESLFQVLQHVETSLLLRTESSRERIVKLDEEPHARRKYDFPISSTHASYTAETWLWRRDSSLDSSMMSNMKGRTTAQIVLSISERRSSEENDNNIDDDDNDEDDEDGSDEDTLSIVVILVCSLSLSLSLFFFFSFLFDLNSNYFVTLQWTIFLFLHSMH